jgi:hypothetical protein
MGCYPWRFRFIYIYQGFYGVGRMLLVGLDPGIGPYVEVLRAAGIETFESCQGGPGHAYAEPTIRFHGHRGEGFKALAVALQRGLPVSDLRRTWPLLDGEPTGPHWEMVFSKVAA